MANYKQATMPANQCRVHTIVGEVQSVIATMRNNNRFSSLSTRENPLLKEFKQLRSILRPSTDIETLEPMDYLKPFLNVIHSEETSGPIKGAALSSIDKFLTYGFLKNTPQSAKAMKKITDTVVRCRFEATNLECDDVVLMKIIRVLYACLSCPAGGLLSDDSVFEMLSICYRQSRGRLPELLKKTAERTMIEIVHIIFLVNNIHNKTYFEDLEDGSPMNTVTTATNVEDFQILPSPSPSMERRDSLKKSVDYVNPRGVRFQRLDGTPITTDSDQTVEFIPKPYGVGCVIRVFKFLLALTSPTDENVPESLRQISFQLLNTIVETQPQLIERIKPLRELLCDSLCKSMLNNLLTDNLDRLNLCMRLFFNLYVSLRKYVKVQLEVFFNNIMTYILKAPSKYVLFEKQELVLEYLIQFFYQPSFISDIFINYDCHLYCTNIFDTLTTYLYKTAFPGALYSIQLLSLECLLALVETIANRCTVINSKSHDEDSILPSTKQLLEQRITKSKLVEAVEEFNKNPNLGIEHLIQHNIIPSNYTSEHLVKFFRTAPGIDKKMLGEYVVKQEKPFVKTFVESFDFTGIDYLNSLRIFLTFFVLRGEAMQIDRIMETFAFHWFSQNPNSIFASRDVVYVLCFSVIMLNVDAHHDGVKSKMTEEEYIYRLRGINENGDIPRDFLANIYQDITSNEIKVVDDSPSGEINDERWPALLRREAQIGQFIEAQPTQFDKDLFLQVSRSTIAALSTVFETSDNAEVIDYILAGFSNCSLIAAYFKTTAVFDNIIINLCKYTTLLNQAKVPKRVSNFGNDKKAQLVTLTTFNLILKYGDYLREGWRNILRCVITLNEMGLLNIKLNEENESIEGRKKEKKVVKKDENGGGGILSFIWWGSNTTPVQEELNPNEIEAENVAKRLVGDCNIKQIIDATRTMQSESLHYFIKALILDSQYKPGQNDFNESNACFCLELLTEITLINHERIDFVWCLVSGHFIQIISTAKQISEYVEQAIICSLLLCVKLSSKREISSAIFNTLELFLKLEPSIANAMSESIIIAVTKLLQSISTYQFISTSDQWRIVMSLVERSAKYLNSCERGFLGLSNLIQTHTFPPFGPIFSPIAFHYYLQAVLAYVNVIETKNNSNQNAANAHKKGIQSSPAVVNEQSIHVPISVKAMNILYALFEGVYGIPELQEEFKSNQVHKTEIWRFYWLPIFQACIYLCRDPRNEIRTHAMTLLQRALFSPKTGCLQILSPDGLHTYFDEVMFPLLNELLKPFNATSEASLANIEETRVRAITLLSKSLLQYLHQITLLSDFHSVLWPKILQAFELYMKADRNGLLKEAIPETLKNILLVMLQMNVFHQELWAASWSSIDSFCPSLKEDESFRASLSTIQRVPQPLTNIKDVIVAPVEAFAVQQPNTQSLGQNGRNQQ